GPVFVPVCVTPGGVDCVCAADWWELNADPNSTCSRVSCCGACSCDACCCGSCCDAGGCCCGCAGGGTGGWPPAAPAADHGLGGVGSPCCSGWFSVMSPPCSCDLRTPLNLAVYPLSAPYSVEPSRAGRF